MRTIFTIPNRARPEILHTTEQTSLEPHSPLEDERLLDLIGKGEKDGSRELRIVKHFGFSKWKGILFYFALFFVSVLIISIPNLALSGLFGAFLSGSWCLFLFVKIVVASPQLTLSNDGFSFTMFGHEKAYLWTDIDSPFDVYGGGRSGFPFVGFCLKNARSAKLNHRTHRGYYRNKLPDNFGMEYRALSNLLNQYWQASDGLREPSPSYRNTSAGVSEMSPLGPTNKNFVLICLWLAVAAVVLLVFLLIHGPITPPENGGKIQCYCSHQGASIKPTPAICLNQ